MTRFSTKWNVFGALLLAVATLLAGNSLAQAKGEKQTLEGTITDLMCGARHDMMKNTTDKQCTIACIKQGSPYALVVGDKVYTLEGKTGDLEKLAGEKVMVTGTLDGNKIQAASVAKMGK